MRAVVKQEKAAKPAEVGLFATEAVMLGAQDFYQAIVEPRSRLAKEQPNGDRRSAGELFMTPSLPGILGLAKGRLN